MFCKINKNNKVIEIGYTNLLYPNSEHIVDEENLYKWNDSDSKTEQLFKPNTEFTAIIENGALTGFTEVEVPNKTPKIQTTAERLTEIETALAAVIGGAN
jgi:hypothetical protein